MNMWCTHVLVCVVHVCTEGAAGYHTPGLQQRSTVCKAAAICHCQRQDVGTDELQV